MSRPSLVVAALCAVFCAALPIPAFAGESMDAEFTIPFEKHVLQNGLEVVIHEDHSDPVVAVYVVYHVGSGREEAGRSGFAHLFEHLMFQGSANVGEEQHFKFVSEAGGTLNGTTNRDRTNYFETVPSNQLELALWLEADRMGFLLPAITQAKLDNQREVVKNERRQNYENRPYGQAAGAIMKALYPAEHAYNWLTIGSHEDLTAASLEDVINFLQRWYGPNNATLAIGGDVDPAQALALVNKYFGSIPRGPDVTAPLPRPAHLGQDLRLAMEDRVKLPQLTMTWPGAERGSEDAAALSMAASVLSANKAALLDKALMIDETLVDYVTAYHRGDEQAGEFSISVRPVPGVSLEEIEGRLRELLARFGEEGLEPDRLERLKARYESNIVNRFETVSRRTSALAEANTFFGDPAAATRELNVALTLSPAQVESAFARYVLEKPAIIMSVVPEGRMDMVASGRDSAQIAQEATFDRSVKPGAGPRPVFQSPPVWHDTLANGVKVTGTRYSEVPIVTLSLSVPGGHLRETMQTLGVSSLTAELMEEGTQDLDAVAFTNALDAMGASLGVSSGSDEITISLRTLVKHLDKAAALLGDVLLRPRFDKADFDRLKTQRLTSLQTRGDQIRTVSRNAWARLMHGDESLAGFPSAGTLETVAALKLSDVMAFYEAAVVPDQARLVVVGDIDAARVQELFAPIMESWSGGSAMAQDMSPRPDPQRNQVFLVDKPGAPQSEIRIGHPGMSVLDEDYYPFTVMNFVLGGTFSSRINLNLREDKGYTYGARSRLAAGLRPGTFTASSGVRTDVTKESVIEVMNELRAIREGITEEETAFAKDSLQQAMTRQYESIRSLQGLVEAISKYGYADDYLEQRQTILRDITKDDMEALAREYVNLEGMTMLVVGDKELVGKSLAELGYGEVIELDIDGNPIPKIPDA
jgi:zinc protease